MTMYLISKNGTDIYNFDHITELYVSNTDGSLRANFDNNARYEIERYDRREDAILAMQIISEKIGKQEVIFTPTQKELQAYRDGKIMIGADWNLDCCEDCLKDIVDIKDVPGIDIYEQFRSLLQK